VLAITNTVTYRRLANANAARASASRALEAALDEVAAWRDKTDLSKEEAKRLAGALEAAEKSSTALQTMRQEIKGKLRICEALVEEQAHALTVGEASLAAAAKAAAEHAAAHEAELAAAREAAAAAAWNQPPKNDVDSSQAGRREAAELSTTPVEPTPSGGGGLGVQDMAIKGSPRRGEVGVKNAVERDRAHREPQPRGGDSLEDKVAHKTEVEPQARGGDSHTAGGAAHKTETAHREPQPRGGEATDDGAGDARRAAGERDAAAVSHAEPRSKSAEV